MKTIVDLLLRNGQVHTLDRRLAIAQAVAVTGSRIVAVGSDEELTPLARPGVKTINLGGRVVTPGFIDSHIHMIDMALLQQGVDLAGASSLEEVLLRVRAVAVRTSLDDWVTGWGWDQYLWPDPSLPDKAHLDAICSDKPVLLKRVDGHSAWVNSLALERLGITEDTPDPSGGVIGRDPATGKTTGILYDAALVGTQDRIPMPDQKTLQGLIRQTVADCQLLGLTGLHDATSNAKKFRKAFAACQTLHQRGDLQMRILAMLPPDELDKIISLGLRTGFGDEMLRLGGIKLFADGSLCSQTALLKEPYTSHAGYYGLRVTPKEELRELVGRAARASISAEVHAIGDRAIEDVLDVFEEFAEYRESLAMPQRIEHSSLMAPAMRQRMAKVGCMIASQPLHITDDMRVAEEHWGEERCFYVHALRDNISAGIRMAFGSDCPVANPDPLKGIYAAVTRQNLDGWPEDGWHLEQRITVEEAVWGYTMGSAAASGEAHLKGSITPGKLADMVVLSQDIFNCEPSRILETQVDMTILDGKIVHRNEEHDTGFDDF